MRSFYDIWQMTLRHITEFCVQLFGDHHRILLAVLRGYEFSTQTATRTPNYRSERRWRMFWSIAYIINVSTYTLLTAKEFEHRLRGLTRYLATRAARAHASISLFSDARFQASSLLSQRREFQQKTDSAKALGSRVETTLHTKNKSQRA